MAISLAEEILSLAQASRHLPNRPHASTMWRYAQRGDLETLRIGGRVFTSREALLRMLARMNGEAIARTPSSRASVVHRSPLLRSAFAPLASEEFPPGKKKAGTPRRGSWAHRLWSKHDAQFYVAGTKPANHRKLF